MKHRRFHPPAHVGAPKGRLSTRRERLVHAGFAALWATGVGWLVFRYFMRGTSEFGELPHPAEAWWLCLHGAAAFLGGFLLYYVADERARTLIAWGHWGIGLATPAPFLWHALRGRRPRH
jgi:predicted MFS family arabinose efflux permease